MAYSGIITANVGHNIFILHVATSKVKQLADKYGNTFNGADVLNSFETMNPIWVSCVGRDVTKFIQGQCLAEKEMWETDIHEIEESISVTIKNYG